ncbi:MAG: EAL domain-containing protein [Campylobacterota bacterium]|nr:EAL domain-containing protein [Campylobacterota bacterium]
MKSINTYYSNKSALHSFIESEGIQNGLSLLVQVFTANNDKVFIEALLCELIELCPDAMIIGSSTDGEIMNGKVSTHQTVLSFAQFEHTVLQTYGEKHQQDGFYSGASLAKVLSKRDTKLIIAFADGLHTNGDAFLNGIHSVNPVMMVAGGLAGDNGTFTQTYVFTQDGIISGGVVGVALSSEHLNVFNDYSFNWRCIGKELTITKAKENRVYTIDNRTAVDTYTHYLGKEMAQGLPSIGIEFPLISRREGLKVARAVLSKYDDGSLGFAGNLNVGDKVQFGYGDPIEILKSSESILNDVKEKPSEAIFVYSCMARRRFMPDMIESETLPLQSVSPTAGFFTYGEFFTSSKKELLNQSMTIVSLSESDVLPQYDANRTSEHTALTTTSINALIHLINTTSHEAMEQEALNVFHMLFEKSPDGILLLENSRFIQCNPKILEMFGYTSKEQFLNARPLELFPKRQPDGSHSFMKLKQMRETARLNGNNEFELLLKKRSGETFWADIMLTSTVLNGKDILYLVCRDMTQRKEMELELARQKNILYYQANHDALTGLPNRAFSMKALMEAIEQNNTLVLMFIDLDGFKRINDTLGHDVGDKVIHIIGERLKRGMRQEDMIARLGGDEFLVMLKGVKQHEGILAEAKRILKLIVEPVSLEHHTLYTSASIGISRYPIDATSADNLLKYADTAMYQAKEAGGNNFKFYSSEMTDIAYEHVIMERDMREGIANEDFEVYYQPQINVESEKVIGLEALVRWNHPVVGFLSPDIFLPIAEKTGLIVELDLWVMRTAMATIARWYDEGLTPGVLALNTSMRQLEYPYLQELIEDNFHTCHFQSQWLELEITETEVMKKPDEIVVVLKRLHQLGISIAIDDFGTGYSSLSHLKRLPIDKLKIDKSFISDIPKNEDAVSIVKTMIGLSQSLRLKLIAEGVENKEQKDFLLKHGCTDVQGYFYSQPLSADAMRKKLIAQG